MKSSPTNKFVLPLIAVIPVPLAAPKPTVFPVTVWLNPLVDTRMPEYFRAVLVKARGAVWKTLLLETVVLAVFV